MVRGKGTLSFTWKVNSETGLVRGRVIPYDKAVFTTGDITKELYGDTNTLVSIELGEGEHLLSWKFIKDGMDENWVGEDCVWLDQIVWTPADPIPEIINPTPKQIEEVLEGAEDPKLAENITNETEYATFRDWAGKVKKSGGETSAGPAGVMASPGAWMSYALGQGALLDAAPTDEDLKVETFEPKAGTTGKFDFTVSVKDVEVGPKAAKENLKKVFGLEGAATLDGAAFSSENVAVEFGTPKGGKVKFTAGPKDASSGAFFMKVKMLP